MHNYSVVSTERSGLMKRQYRQQEHRNFKSANTLRNNQKQKKCSLYRKQIIKCKRQCDIYCSKSHHSTSLSSQKKHTGNSIILKSEKTKKTKILLFAVILLIFILSAIIKCSSEGMQIDTIQHLSDIMWAIIEAIL